MYLTFRDLNVLYLLDYRKCFLYIDKKKHASEGVEKVTGDSRKWVYIMLKDGRPSKSDQIAAARAWGASVDGEYSTMYIDDVRKVRTTAPGKVLEERAELIRALKVAKSPNDAVFFRNPLCIGFSQADAKSTVDAIWANRAMVYVHSEDVLYRAGDDLTELLHKFQQDYNAMSMRLSRARGKSSGNKGGS